MTELTPAGKAHDLHFTFLAAEKTEGVSYADAKVFAAICVKEIMADGMAEWNDTSHDPYEHARHYEYWNQVLDEISKL